MAIGLRRLILAAAAALAWIGTFAESPAATFAIRTEFPATDGRVRAIVVDETHGRIYLGGTFDHVGGDARTNLAAIDLATGALLPWSPQLNGSVSALTLGNGTLYVGGNFTTVDSNSRGRGAAFNTLDNSLLAWDPGLNSSPLALAVDGSSVYLGGDFTQAGSVAAFRLAQVNATTGVAVNWTPNPETTVYAVAAKSGFAYAGGAFTTIGGRPYKYLASLDGSTTNGDALFGWNPNPDGLVRALLVNGTRLYLGGEFLHVPAVITQHLRLASLALSSGTDDAPLVDYGIEGSSVSVLALAISGTHLYAGGDFTGAQSQPRAALASFDSQTGAVSPWNPDIAGGNVEALAVSGYTVFVGGTFSSVGGVVRSNFAAVIDPDLPGAPSLTPGSSPATVAISGKKKITTTKAKLTIKGTAANAARVEVQVGKALYKTASGTAAWTFQAKLKPGKNKILARAVNSSGTASPTAAVTVIRK